MELVAQTYLLSNMAYSAESEVYSKSIQGENNQGLCLLFVILTMKFKRIFLFHFC